MMFQMSLLDAMYMQTNCPCLSDLRRLHDWQKARLARSLERIPPEAGIAPRMERRPGVSGKGTSPADPGGRKSAPDHRTIRPGRRCGRRLPASAFLTPIPEYSNK